MNDRLTAFYFFISPSMTCLLFFPKSGKTNETCTHDDPVLGLVSQIN